MRNLKVNVSLALVALALAALVLPQPAQAANACEMGLCNFTYQTILPEGYQSASFDSVNESGMVVGSCTADSGAKWGFLYSLTTGNFVPFRPDGWKGAFATCINESDVVVGGGNDGSGKRKGFIYDPTTGTFTELLPTGWEEAKATHINDTGTVVGYGKKTATDTTFTSFIYKGKTFTEINLFPALHNVQATGINNGDKVVGTANDPNIPPGTGFWNPSMRGFLYDSQTEALTIMDPGDWNWTGALNINQLDEVAGWGEDGSGNSRGYLYSEGSYTPLSHATLPYTVANDVSDTGLVVGTFNDDPGYAGSIGFIYDSNSAAYIELDPGWYYLAPRAVNAAEVVVGWCQETEGGSVMAFVATPPGMPKPLHPNLVKQDVFLRNPDAYKRVMKRVAEVVVREPAYVISNLK